MENQLSFDVILTLAERESGGHGLADEKLRDRVSYVVEWINERGPYSSVEVRAMHGQISHLLARRLAIAVDRQRYSEIAEVRIEKPIFIIGFARSGTTLLHSLLAEDPDVFSPKSWNVFSPSPPPGAGPVVSERLACAQRQLEGWMDLCPAQKPMHPYVDKGAVQLIEDEEIFSLDFRNTYPYQFYKVPTMDRMVVVDSDHGGWFDFHRQFLQHMQWKSEQSQVVCKGVSAQHSLHALFETYPDALCIWPHRPLAEIFASLVVLSAACSDAITGKPCDLQAHARELAEGMRAGFDHLTGNALIDDPRVMHIPFRRIVADPLAEIRSIYARVGRSVGPVLEQRIQSWLADPANSIERYGRYPYSYEAMGLDPQWIEGLFADYSKRFGLV